jgi:hypothetical protein
MAEHRCPDCEQGMDAVDLETGEGRFSVVTESGDDVLSAVGIAQVQEVEPRMCPDCGLVRLYADRR